MELDHTLEHLHIRLKGVADENHELVLDINNI